LDACFPTFRLNGNPHHHLGIANFAKKKSNTKNKIKGQISSNTFWRTDISVYFISIFVFHETSIQRSFNGVSKGLNDEYRLKNSWFSVFFIDINDLSLPVH
jgi:hypothetical protein